jgi:hypothetical protein
MSGSFFRGIFIVCDSALTSELSNELLTRFAIVEVSIYPPRYMVMCDRSTYLHRYVSTYIRTYIRFGPKAVFRF